MELRKWQRENGVIILWICHVCFHFVGSDLRNSAPWQIIQLMYKTCDPWKSVKMIFVLRIVLVRQWRKYLRERLRHNFEITLWIEFQLKALIAVHVCFFYCIQEKSHERSVQLTTQKKAVAFDPRGSFLSLRSQPDTVLPVSRRI